MGFVSFLGRVLFSAIFVLSAWQKMQDFGSDGGPPLRAMEPKLKTFLGHVEQQLGVTVPPLDPKLLLLTANIMEGAGGILFTIGSSTGAWLLLLFIAAVTPIMHDFYNYDPSSPEFLQEFVQFLKNLALFGALLFYLGMRGSAAKLARKRKATSMKMKST